MLALTPPDSGQTVTRQEAAHRLMERLNPSDLQLLTSKDEFSRFSFNGRERKCLFVNGRGKRFLEAAYPLGLDSDVEGRGAAVADLDQDGRLDILLRAVARKKLTYFHNELPVPGHFLRVELEGTRSNRDAVGAIVRIYYGEQQQMRTRTAGSGFQSQSEGTLHFGLGSAMKVEALRVEWPSGSTETFHEIPADYVVKVVEGAGTLSRRRPAGWRGAASPRPSAGIPAWSAREANGGAWTPPAGRPAFITFWASWCEACRSEVAALNRLSQKLGGVATVAGVGLGEEAATVQSFRSATDARYKLLTSSQRDISRLLEQIFPEGEISLPAAVLLDTNGMPRRVFRGMVNEAAIERQIATLLR